MVKLKSTAIFLILEINEILPILIYKNIENIFIIVSC
jgi:hypothetical protein